MGEREKKKQDEINKKSQTELKSAPKDTDTQNRTKWLLGKEAVPLQAWTGPEGSKKLRLPDFKTVGT